MGIFVLTALVLCVSWVVWTYKNMTGIDCANLLPNMPPLIKCQAGTELDEKSLIPVEKTIGAIGSVFDQLQKLPKFLLKSIGDPIDNTVEIRDVDINEGEFVFPDAPAEKYFEWLESAMSGDFALFFKVWPPSRDTIIRGAQTRINLLETDPANNTCSMTFHLWNQQHWFLIGDDANAACNIGWNRDRPPNYEFQNIFDCDDLRRRQAIFRANPQQNFDIIRYRQEARYVGCRPGETFPRGQRLDAWFVYLPSFTALTGTYEEYVLDALIGRPLLLNEYFTRINTRQYAPNYGINGSPMINPFYIPPLMRAYGKILANKKNLTGLNIVDLQQHVLSSGSPETFFRRLLLEAVIFAPLRSSPRYRQKFALSRFVNPLSEIETPEGIFDMVFSPYAPAQNQTFDLAGFRIEYADERFRLVSPEATSVWITDPIPRLMAQARATGDPLIFGKLFGFGICINALNDYTSEFFQNILRPLRETTGLRALANLPPPDKYTGKFDEVTADSLLLQVAAEAAGEVSQLVYRAGILDVLRVARDPNIIREISINGKKINITVRFPRIQEIINWFPHIDFSCRIV